MRTRYLLLLLPLTGCSFPQPVPPSAEFLVADGASTYWVTSGPDGIRARVAPLTLTRTGGRYYQIYVSEVARSYEDALFTREPIYRRDLLTGDSMLVMDESRVSAWERMYLATHPAAQILDPESEGEWDQNLSYAASSEADILGVFGPYVMYAGRYSLQTAAMEEADSSRGAIDLRVGKRVPLSVVARDSSAFAAAGTRAGGVIRWRREGFDIVGRYDSTRLQTEVLLRDIRKREWALGYVDSRTPLVFWLDEPEVDTTLRTALTQAFNDALLEDEATQLVSRGGRASAASSGGARLQ